jgi:hypothetical protein
LSIIEVSVVKSGWRLRPAANDEGTDDAAASGIREDLRSCGVTAIGPVAPPDSDVAQNL